MTNEAAAALGRMAKGRKKNFSAAYRKTLSERLKRAREKAPYNRGLQSFPKTGSQ